MAIADISVIALGTGSASEHDYVREAVRVLERRGLKHEVGAMGTAVEGNIDDILAALTEIHSACFALGAPRLVITLKIDDRRDKEQSIESKKNAAQQG